MDSNNRCVVLQGIGVSLLLVGSASAQTSMPAPSPAPATGSAGGNGVAITVLIIAVIIILGAIAKFIDLRRKRAEQSVALESQVSDALLRDQNFVGRSVTPTVHLPLFGGSPATIVLTGQVEPQLREPALRLVQQEASRVRSDFTIEDRLSTVGAGRERAA